MSPVVEKVIVSLVTACFLGLGGWVYATGERVAALETHVEAEMKTINDIHEDVRELRRVLIGPREP